MSSDLDFDVVIVGAGLSGIGAACRVKMGCPTKTLAVLEARDAIGGTWDLFRYPGVRSDSDMFTLGYPFHPWTDAKTIADGDAILRYIRETSTTFGVDSHVRFRHRLFAASWSSRDARWTLQMEVGEERAVRQITCRFLYTCTGYYSYDKAFDPDLTDKDTFAGTIIHPQWWPADLDYEGKRVVVIGSGATAVTLVPAMAERAAHVTMLQRSPTYIMSLPDRDPVADALRAVLPTRLAHRLARAKNVLMGLAFYKYCRAFPKHAARLLQREVAKLLPEGYPVDVHFAPRYDPWDQRLCVVPNADLFAAISSGKASVATDTIERFTEHGIRLSSGEELAADIVVTATGLHVIPLGGVRVSVDDVAIVPGDTVVYRGVMLSGVPNFAWCVGYTNASWTLRADLSSRYVCRLLNEMDRRGHSIATPTPKPGDEQGEGPILDLASGYVIRARALLPRQGVRAPWILRQNYVLDRFSTLLGRVDESMTFSDAGPRATRVDQSASPSLSA